VAFIRQPLDEFLGIECERTGPGEVRARLAVRSLFVNSLGVVHGGVIATLADVAMSNLADPAPGGVQTAVTSDLHVTFLAPARGEALQAEARVLRAGRRLLYADCRIYDDGGRLVARAVGTFVRRGRPRGTTFDQN
jgi:uncharacterized protein (TIGR00369 family)